MEHIFRRVEYWIEGDWKYQQRLNKMPWNAEKIRKKTLKHGVFLLLAFAIANTFLAYLIGSDRLLAMQFTHPTENLVTLTALVVFSVVFYGVFAFFREQVCIAVCPYGRLQGVMLDRNSIVVAYDYVRGEMRARFRKGENRDQAAKGDCIDCDQCVVVCPTGIDIRNGTQLECINCTACMDACDTIMGSIGLPKGLIRYASEAEIADNRKWEWSPRIIGYTVVLGVLLLVVGTLLFTRTDVETTLLRTGGLTYQQKGEGEYSNLYNFKVVNKTNRDMQLSFRVKGNGGRVEFIGQPPNIRAQQRTEGALFLILAQEQITSPRQKVELEVYADGQLLETLKTNFVGPIK